MNNTVLFGDVVQHLVWLCIVAIIVTLLFLRIFIKNNKNVEIIVRNLIVRTIKMIQLEKMQY